ncbi:MAG: TldD/PmbA family protein [Candidatus Zipacnadales bacterium]
MRDALRWIIDMAQRLGVEFADGRVVEKEITSLRRQDGKTDRLRQTSSLGVGIRVLIEGAWGFASTNNTSREDLRQCLETALDMARASQARVAEPGVVALLEPCVDVYTAPVEIDPATVPLTEKMKVVNALEEAARTVTAEKTANSLSFYRDVIQREIVCNTHGTDIDHTATRTSLGLRITAVEGDARQSGFEHKSGLGGFEIVEEADPVELGHKAASTAIRLLKADRAPSGKFPVILHPTIVGVFIHEALGHNAEADLVLGGDSILDGKLGTQVASELVTVVDDSTIPGSWGSYKYDSEGTPGQRRTLIEKGILKGFMHSLETAARMGVEPNGSGRAQGYDSRPIVRMSNTIVLPGTATLEDLAKDIDLGVLLEGGEWGYVMTAKGHYTCHAGYGRMIRHGQIAEPLRDVSVAGVILDTLINVDGVTEEFEMLTMGGMCGKNGQAMYTNGGGPYMRVRELVVGGQQRLTAEG